MFNINNYIEAEDLSHAVEVLADNPKLLVIAGGTDLLIKMYGGKIEEAGLLSIRSIKELKRVNIYDDGTIGIGPLITFSDIAINPIINEQIPILVQAALSVGGPQIRNTATIGGNICNGAVSADSAPALHVLDAELKIRSKNGSRIISIADFYLGPGKVDLKQGEILEEIIIHPKAYNGFRGNYIKFSMRKAMDIATLGVAVNMKIKNKEFEEVKIGLGVAGPTPIRCIRAENYAKGRPVSDETIAAIGKHAVTDANPRTSWRASKEYREHLIEELVQRAIKKVFTENSVN